ncbi:Phosphate-specific transport system accessory protein PhoU [Candidatus Desulfarcum epimagneticum]|uniref:Phosphate-specific transport system accessory protein PhoU n=1 Tax=uncultured Desulfobacteraceae bacterium TaxID=218296 RepID=A0A484HIH7_9BACT|nr:Phosphate-specific transport system accessory protein PhoU [uncultured Desulfobacteraceae bacterium]
MSARHFRRELEAIKKKILTLGAVVEGRLRKAIEAVAENDLKTAGWIAASDYEVDEMEVEIEEECLKIIALHQPVAVDLRFLAAVIKINSDLERIADLTVNIARRVQVVSQHNPLEKFMDYANMGEKVKYMLSKSLDALVHLDSEAARMVGDMDDEVDDLRNLAYKRIKTALKKNPEMAGRLINYYLISRHLERIADHATNIAEDVIYMIDGEIVRHDI